MPSKACAIRTREDFVPHISRRWYFNKRPQGLIEADTLTLREEPIPSLSQGEILIRSIYLSLDATNRVWLSDWDIYMDPVALGDPMRGFIVGEVIESKHATLRAGDLVSGLHTWSDFIVAHGDGFQAVQRVDGISVAEAFAMLTVAGPTAYVGLLDIGRPKSGETIVVTAAAGAVGAAVGQIAKMHGCRVVGLASGQDKRDWLTKELGFDAAIDYRGDDLVDRLRDACPDGIDVLFENVGGAVLDAGLTLMNNFGRVVICGLISTYNSSEPTPGPYMFRNLIMRRLRVEGFVILDYLHRYPEIYEKLIPWMRSGALKQRLHIVDGIENAAAALKLLYTGGNNGKLMVGIGPEKA
jgi:NADPH-dependent curcumin reductase CurA